VLEFAVPTDALVMGGSSWNRTNMGVARRSSARTEPDFCHSKGWRRVKSNEYIERDQERGLIHCEIWAGLSLGGEGSVLPGHARTQSIGG
jgi:hypothetical protein